MRQAGQEGGGFGVGGAVRALARGHAAVQLREPILGDDHAPFAEEGHHGRLGQEIGRARTAVAKDGGVEISHLGVAQAALQLGQPCGGQVFVAIAQQVDHGVCSTLRSVAMGRAHKPGFCEKPGLAVRSA